MSNNVGLDHIYYNATIINNTSAPAPATYSATLTSYILNNPSEWWMSIIRFNIPGYNIPLFEFKPNTYYVSFVYNGEKFTQVVTQFINSANGNLIFNYQTFLTDINLALINAFKAFSGTYTKGPVEAPAIKLDPKSQLFYFAFDPSWINSGEIPQIFMNTALFSFFSSFPYIFNGYDHEYLNYQISFDSLTQLNSSLLVIYQEYVSIHLWSSLNTLFVTSNSIPVNSEYVSLFSNTAIPNFQKIITDFQPPENNQSQSSNVLQYQPSGPYRLINLISNEPLKIIDFNIYWVDNLQKQHQLYLPPFSSATMKILFLKKSVYLTSLKDKFN